jgi:hypothetical protein
MARPHAGNANPAPPFMSRSGPPRDSAPARAFEGDWSLQPLTSCIKRISGVFLVRLSEQFSTRSLLLREHHGAFPRGVVFGPRRTKRPSCVALMVLGFFRVIIVSAIGRKLFRTQPSWRKWCWTCPISRANQSISFGLKLAPGGDPIRADTRRIEIGRRYTLSVKDIPVDSRGDRSGHR